MEASDKLPDDHRGNNEQDASNNQHHIEMNTETVVRWWPVIYRASLYFAIAVLAVFAAELKPYADAEVMPSAGKLSYIAIGAVLSGLVTIRAYFDGSAQRRSDELKDHDSIGN
jgi:hypothetical protein